ncbi:MAG: MATE family efflux transporter [Actinomycetota bacterium]|nr:MATE family efflux transporter [Actinomycetota bacterium]
MTAEPAVSVSAASSRVLPGRHPEDRVIAALAVPALGALAADPLYSLVDTAFVGHLGVAQLGGLSIGVAAFTASFWIFSFLAYGVTPRVARALGAGSAEDATRVGIQALLLALLLGGAVSAIGFFLAGPVVRAFGASDDVVRYAEPYLRIRALAAIPVLIAQVGQGYLRGAHDTRTPTVVVVAGAAANVIVGYVFIFVLGWGIEGAAWAVVLCQAGAAAAFLVILRRTMVSLRWRPEPVVMRSLLRVGGELALRSGSLLAGLTIATSVAARIGTTTIAAWQVAMQLFLLLSLTLDAVAIAAQALVATQLGAGDESRARAVGQRLIGLGLYVGSALGLLLFIAASPLGGVFTEAPDVAPLATQLLIWLALLQPLGAVAFTLDGILIGASDTGFLALAMVGSSAVFVASMLALHRADAGVWSLVVGMSLWIALRAGTGLYRFRGPGWTGGTAA